MYILMMIYKWLSDSLMLLKQLTSEILYYTLRVSI